MAKKLLIILVNSNPDNPEALGAPFFQATVAAAMDYEVEILMTGRAGELASTRHIGSEYGWVLYLRT